MMECVFPRSLVRRCFSATSNCRAPPKCRLSFIYFYFLGQILCPENCVLPFSRTSSRWYSGAAN